MKKDETDKLLEMFSDGSGFGDPDARRNAEMHLQVFLARGQQKAANRLNWLTFFLVVEGLLNVVVIAYEIIKK